MTDDLRQAFDRAVLASDRRSWIPGRLGRDNSDGSVTIAMESRTNWVYVSIGTDGSQGVTTARNDSGVPHRAYLPVKMRRSRDGSLMIVGINNEGGVADVGVGSLTDEYGILSHPNELNDVIGVAITSAAENDSFWYDGSGWVNGRGHRLNIGISVDSMISAGILDIDTVDKQHGLMGVRGEGGADDDLTSIAGGNIGDVVVLINKEPGSYGTITVKNTGNINVLNDVILDNTDDLLALVLTLAGWNPIGAIHFLDDLGDVSLASPVANDSLWHDGTSWVNGAGHRLNMGTVEGLTISGGDLDISAREANGYFSVRSEVPNNPDTLVTVSGGNEGDIIVLEYSGGGEYITIVNTGGVGGIKVSDEGYVLEYAGELLVLIYFNNGWRPIGQIDTLDSLSDVDVISPAANDDFYYDGTSWVSGAGHRLNIGLVATIEISSDILTISASANRGIFGVRGEGGSSDDLVTITGGITGDVILLRKAGGSFGHITVKNTGNIAIPVDFKLSSALTSLFLVLVGAIWYPIVDIDSITPTTTKGDLLVEDGFNIVRLPVGTDNQFLKAVSTEQSGLLWVDIAIMEEDGSAGAGLYAKFVDPLILEGKAVDEVLADLSGQAIAAFDWNNQDVVNIQNLGVGTQTPQGALHVDDGLFQTAMVSFLNVAATERTLISSGITRLVTGPVILSTSSSNNATGTLLLEVPPSGLVFQDIALGGANYQFRLYSTGALTVIRTSGGTNAEIMVFAHYI